MVIEAPDVVLHGDGRTRAAWAKSRPSRPLFLPRTHDAPGGVDDGPVAVLVKGILYVLRSPPLGAVAGHQEEGVLQALAQGPDVGGVGGPGDGPSHGIAVLALGPLSDPLIQVAHHLIDQPSPATISWSSPEPGLRS